MTQHHGWNRRRFSRAIVAGLHMILISAAPWSSPAPSEQESNVTRTPANISEQARNAGLVSVEDLVPDLALDIRYAGDDNFTGEALYPASRCWLMESVALQLARVQQDLARDGLGIKVFDCYRPFHVQEKMWRLIRDERYVSKPVRDSEGRMVEGSRHSRGAAVDVSLVALETGLELPMPTAYDDFSETAHRDHHAGLTTAQIDNRERLADAMARHGFVGLATEWWHFDAEGWHRYPLLDIPIE